MGAWRGAVGKPSLTQMLKRHALSIALFGEGSLFVVDAHNVVPQYGTNDQTEAYHQQLAVHELDLDHGAAEGGDVRGVVPSDCS